MTTTLQIRPAQPSDVADILAMIRELAEFEHLSHLVEATEAKLMADLFGSQPAAECVVATVGDSPAGFALFFHNYSTFLAKRGLYLEDLFVRPAFRRHGVGKALIRHLGRLAVERGCGRFEWCVLDWNANAIAFYQGLGATVMPDWRLCRVTGDALTAIAQPDA
ncbi:GNAT family N-acetyltransferase [Andreprevotia chitinilytica]|uniref:GNAT family N-acetyltransferase n=1 Tax=Andreprevotia chitinilytica TaxID=396808 RepID=UPI000552DF86|nr:GNAT family N-acetyltransferase [Andreprevotia chitinilytica]